MAHDGSRLDPAGTGERPNRRRGPIAGAAVLLVILALYVAAALYFSDKVPVDTRVGGIPIGGTSQAQARQLLEDGLADEEAEPVIVTVEEKPYELTPAEAGLGYDYEGSLDGLTGFSLNPVSLWTHVSGGPDLEVEVEIDEDALTAAVDDATRGLDAKPVEGEVTLVGAAVKKRASKPGLTVDRAQVAQDIADAWPGQHEFAAPTSTPAPKLGQDEIDRFAEDDLGPLVSGPVRLSTTDPGAQGAGRWISFDVPAEQLAPAISITNERGKLSVTVDEKKVGESALTAAKASGNFSAARDAGVTYRGGENFDVTPSRSGLALEEEGIASKVAEAMTKTGADARAVRVDSRELKPDFTTAEAKSTLPQEQISTFTTNLPDNPTRTGNIKIAARALDGAYVAPGETFSLNAQLGERTPARGYAKAGVISGGRLTDDYGGGISQLSTTLFNAVFFSGAKIEEFHPHSFYISRYPEGREATISWPDLDNRFTNDTGAGILILASVSGDEVTVSFDGRKAYDEVRASKSARRNSTPPTTIRDNAAGCVPQSPNPGFSVDITRTFIKGGSTVKSSTFTTTYAPQDSVTCTG